MSTDAMREELARRVGDILNRRCGQERMVGYTLDAQNEIADAIIAAGWSRAPAHQAPESAGGWRPIESAKKDGSVIWARFHSDIYPRLRPGRKDLVRWNGAHAPLRHQGLARDGFDIGWEVALPVGSGGFPDEWIARWQPLPALPADEAV